MKEFFGGSSPKDIYQVKLNSMMEKSNSDNPMGMKRNTPNTVVYRKDEKHYMQKKRKKEKPLKKEEINT